MIWFGASVALALLLVSVLPAFAQGTSSSTTRGSSAYSTAPGAGVSIDDATLKRTARAFVKVQQIAKQESSALSGAGNDASRRQLAQRAESEKVAAVQSEGLQPEQYNRVLMMVQADKALQQRFLTYVQQAS
jgi:hypothetical protein